MTKECYCCPTVAGNSCSYFGRWGILQVGVTELVNTGGWNIRQWCVNNQCMSASIIIVVLWLCKNILGYMRAKSGIMRI